MRFWKLAHRVLFDDVWERKELSKRDRSLITVAALIACAIPARRAMRVDPMVALHYE